MPKNRRVGTTKQMRQSMRKTILCISMIAAILLMVQPIMGQQLIMSSGGNASGPGGSASYSVGQLLTTTASGTNGSAAHGMQQPYEISIITAINPAEEIIIDLLVYPNPVSNGITLKSEYFLNRELLCQIFDSYGMLTAVKQIVDEETNVDMSNYLSGTYFIKIIEKTKTIKTIKIIKN